MSMIISNELLAAYAVGAVTKEERNHVRQYLAENSYELESVMMMMDDDYELMLDKDFDNSSQSNFGNSKESSFFDLCYGAAAFAPRHSSTIKNMTKDDSKIKDGFGKRLDDLINELGI